MKTEAIIFKPGDKVTYCPKYGMRESGHGIVKSVQSTEYVFVVYNCAGAWEHYESYTAARTNVSDLKLGWL